MTKTEDISAKRILVAIDISKLRNDILIQQTNGRRRRMQITNERVDHDRLVDQLQKMTGDVHACFEATGNYHRSIAWRLLTAGFNVHLISSVALARTREALHNTWDKNDPKDAQVMLYMLNAGQVQRYYDPLYEHFNDCQEMSKTHEAISKVKTETLHRLLTHYLPLYFPEIGKFRHNSRSEWFFKFLYEFPIPHLIAVLSESEFIEKATPLVGRKVHKAQVLCDMYRTAQSSAGLPVAADSAAVQMYRLVIMQMRQLIQHRDEIEREAQRRLKGHPDFERLQQIPGIGPIHALTILAEAGDLRRFDHYRQFLKYCGFDLATRQSGQYRGRTMLSKYGNARLRKAFWMAGQVAVLQRENSFKDKFKRYTAKDRDDRDLKRKAYTAVAAKVARVAYSIIKYETDYRPFYGAR
jgi:transposase